MIINNYLDENNQPNYDLILSGLTYPNLKSSILGQSQYTKELLKITENLKIQGYNHDFILKVVTEANMRFIANCRLQSEEY